MNRDRTLPAILFCASLIAVSAVAAEGAEIRLAWEKGHPNRADWSRELRKQLSAKLSSFEDAEDIKDYCPSYPKLTPAQKIDVLATVAVRIAKFESGYDPKQHLTEGPPLNYDSIGLFQLSYEDGFSWCSLDSKKKSLEEPINNIRCAVPEMARLVAKDKVISAGDDAKNAGGLARYWSVLREGAKHHKKDIQNAARSLKICS